LACGNPHPDAVSALLEGSSGGTWEWTRHGICTPTSCDLGSRTRPSSKFLRVRGGSRGGTLNGGRLPETSNCSCHPGKAGGLPLCAKLENSMHHPPFGRIQGGSVRARA